MGLEIEAPIVERVAGKFICLSRQHNHTASNLLHLLQQLNADSREEIYLLSYYPPKEKPRLSFQSRLRADNRTRTYTSFNTRS